jgi:signal transduction histidine kinase/CheY-like chemotaxis protein
LLTVAALLPIIVFAAVAAAISLGREQATIEREAVDRAHRLMDLVDRELRSQTDLVRTLAALPGFDSPIDHEWFRELGGRVMREHRIWDAVILSDLAGNRVAAVGASGGTGPVVERASHDEVIATGVPVIGRIGVGPGGRAGLPIRAPINRDDKFINILTIVVRPDSIRELLLESQIPPEWIGTIADGSGRVVARTAGDASLLARPVSDTAMAARTRGGEGTYAGRTLEGTETVSAYRISAATNWSVHIGVPRAIFRAPLSRLAWLTGGGAFASLLLAGAFALLLVRELRLRRNEAQAFVQAQRMESLGRLTGGVAHDFNNLLTVILGNLSLLETKLRGGVEERRVAVIRRAAERGANLTAQLLAFTRGGSSEIKVIDLNQRIRAVLPMLRETLRSNIAIELDLAPNLPAVAIDPLQLDLALLNLAANARDAMPDGGLCQISSFAAAAKAGSGTSAIGLAISDTGTGVAPDDLPHVFEPFFTTKEPGKGTGLGLTQVYGFARQAGGSAEIASEPGRGTTVTLHLPASTGAPEIIEHIQAPIKTGGVRSQVLVVDDDPDVRSITSEYLRDRGYVVREAGDADAALALLERDAFAAVISDIMMPGRMDGLDLARACRRRWPQLPVLLISGFSAATDDAAKEGLTVLLKPYSPEVLANSLNEVMGLGKG